MKQKYLFYIWLLSLSGLHTPWRQASKLHGKIYVISQSFLMQILCSASGCTLKLHQIFTSVLKVFFLLQQSGMSCRKEIILKFVLKQSAGILKGIIARIGEEYTIRFFCLAITYPFTIHIGSLKITETKQTKEPCSSDFIRWSACWRYI